ncbi:MAG: hypothetical protein ACLQIB_37800, partial [Isosphaeraceae bacterium]
WSSGPVQGEPSESWQSLDISLRNGRRGLPGGTTLSQLLAKQRQAPNIYTEPPLAAEQILAWAEAHRAATGRWPSSRSGPVLHAEGERWGSIDTALREGYRGLPGGQLLGRLIRPHGGPDVYRTRPALTVEQVLAWADAHREATGECPSRNPGRSARSPGRPGRRSAAPWPRAIAACRAARRWRSYWPSTAAPATVGPPSSDGRADPRVGRRPPRRQAERHIGPGRRRARREMDQPRSGVTARPPRSPARYDTRPPHRRSSGCPHRCGGRDAIAE